MNQREDIKNWINQNNEFIQNELDTLQKEVDELRKISPMNEEEDIYETIKSITYWYNLRQKQGLQTDFPRDEVMERLLENTEFKIGPSKYYTVDKFFIDIDPEEKVFDVMYSGKCCARGIPERVPREVSAKYSYLQYIEGKKVLECMDDIRSISLAYRIKMMCSKFERNKVRGEYESEMSLYREREAAFDEQVKSFQTISKEVKNRIVASGLQEIMKNLLKKSDYKVSLARMPRADGDFPRRLSFVPEDYEDFLQYFDSVKQA